MKTIKVTGKGNISLSPDEIQMRISMETQDYDYSMAIDKAESDINALREAFSEVGFNKEDLKTTSFNVEKNYKSYYDDNNNWHRDFEGYKVSHRLKLPFDNDNELLNKAIYQLASSGVDAEFRLVYTVKDTEAAKNELLAKAIADSKKKAEIMAASAEVSLGEIQAIDYSWGQIVFESEPMTGMDIPKYLRGPIGELPGESCCIDIVPDDIEANDTVTVLWEIK